MEPNFNTWTIIFLIASAQGFFTALIFLKWRHGNPQANRILSALIALFSLSMFEYVLYWTNYIYYWPHFANLSVNFPFLYGALFWLYLRTIYTGKALTRSDVWHLLPFLLASFPFLPWYFADLELKRTVISGEQKFPYAGWAIRLQFSARIVYIVFMVVWNFRFVARQVKLGQSLIWANTLVVFQLIFTLAYISYFILIQYPFFSPLWDYHISAVMTAMIYLTAYLGYVQPSIFNGLNWSDTLTNGKYKNSGLTLEAGQSLLKNLEITMKEECLYHDPEFSLDKLAKHLKAGKHHVSQVINEHLGMSFFEYVNHLRIKEAMQTLTETTRSDMHIIEVAYAVGFNNKMSFNSAFKKATGMTPTEFRRNHGKSDTEPQQPQEAG